MQRHFALKKKKKKKKQLIESEKNLFQINHRLKIKDQSRREIPEQKHRRSSTVIVSDNTLLAIDSVPPHGLVQPPPYISPPNSEQCRKKERIQEISNNPSTVPHKIQNEKQQTCGRQSSGNPVTKIHDPRRSLYDANNKLMFDQCNPLDRNDLQRVRDPRRIVDMRNARNQQYYAPPKDSKQQFYTLPSRRPQRDVEPPRSVTPDITRGLGRGGSLATMHVLARHGHRAMMEQDSNRYGSQAELNKRNSEAENRLMQNHEHSSIVDMRNR